ncbi:dihydropteroate synthase [Pseudonocardia thermophila]|uniref:Dihydropteroate synthase n=2 Tax=Pseudonocardia thermophila TaxID=1848 RepID=A0A1M6UL58_PSETH|nr:dihydropteroate synthase [Pseudonocardia thermophila]
MELPRPGRCVVMGILNVTPDSFSDGGRYFDHDAAVAHGLAMHRAGADYVDVGGESTRPGAQRVDLEEEAARVLPVVTDLAAEGVAVSIDTMRASVAEAAVRAGAVLVNDVSAGQADPDMARCVADLGVPWVLMHGRGPSATMNERAVYQDVVAEVRAELQQRVDAALAAGVDPSRIVVDPGLGFAKHGEHNWALLRNLDRFTELGFPVLIGASRKRFLGELLADAEGNHRPTEGRGLATAVISGLAALAGAWGVRVHDVGQSLDAVAVAAAWSGQR